MLLTCDCASGDGYARSGDEIFGASGLRNGVRRGLTGDKDLPLGDRTALGGDISASAAVDGRPDLFVDAGSKLLLPFVRLRPPLVLGRHLNPTFGGGDGGPAMGAKLRVRDRRRVEPGVRLACGL